MAKEKIQVIIDDMTFVVVGGDGEDYVKGLAKTLNAKIEETRSSNYRLNQVQSLVLMSLNILDEKEKILQKNQTILSISGDEQEVLDGLKELEDCKKAISEYETRRVKYEELISELNVKTKELEKENKKLEMTLSDKEDSIKELREANRMAKEENLNLEEQIYDSQKKIIDLNREIESITDDEE